MPSSCLTMWGIGALLLVSVIGLSGRADKHASASSWSRPCARTQPEVPGSRGTGGPPRRCGSWPGQPDRQLAFRFSIARLQALGDSRYAVPIAAAAAMPLTTDGMIAGLVAIDGSRSRLAVTRARSARRHRVRPADGAQPCGRRLPTEENARSRSASVASVVLTLVLLIAFTGAFYRSMSARRRAEALSVDKQVLLEQSQSDATTDALTGMANRRKLFDDTDRLLASLGEGSTVSLGIFDLNGFKNYNDSFGHPAGDALLAHLGHQLTEAMTGRATAYRMGGDEFCVVTAAPDAVSVSLAAAASRPHASGASASRSPAPTASRRSRRGIPPRAGPPDRGPTAVRQQGADPIDAERADQGRADPGARRAGWRPRAAPEPCRAARGQTGSRLGLSIDEIARIRLAAELHDIGKAAVPGVILEQARSPRYTELAYLRQHSLIGERILSAAPALANVRSARARDPRASGRHRVSRRAAARRRFRSALASSPSSTHSTR